MPTSPENALGRAAIAARARLNHETETQARIVIDLHERAGALRELLDGETQALKAEWEEREEAARDERRGIRLERESRRGLESRAQCQQCHRFKSKPADRCDYCGNEPLTHNGDVHEFNRAYGHGW